MTRETLPDFSGVYLMKYLPGGLVYLTDEHIGRNALRFEGEMGGAR